MQGSVITPGSNIRRRNSVPGRAQHTIPRPRQSCAFVPPQATSGCSWTHRRRRSDGIHEPDGGHTDRSRNGNPGRLVHPAAAQERLAAAQPPTGILDSTFAETPARLTTSMTAPSAL